MVPKYLCLGPKSAQKVSKECPKSAPKVPKKSPIPSNGIHKVVTKALFQGRLPILHILIGVYGFFCTGAGRGAAPVTLIAMLTKIDPIF
jgi:hypothetical protein